MCFNTNSSASCSTNTCLKNLNNGANVKIPRSVVLRCDVVVRCARALRCEFLRARSARHGGHRHGDRARTLVVKRRKWGNVRRSGTWLRWRGGRRGSVRTRGGESGSDGCHIMSRIVTIYSNSKRKFADITYLFIKDTRHLWLCSQILG